MKIKVAYFEITNTCNLNCQTCYNSSALAKERLEISPTQLRHGINTLLPLGLQRVLISGGEPALHSQFESILHLVDEYPQLSFGIVTNATVHNKNLIKILNSTERFTLQISLDGSCEEQNARTRGVGNFDKAINFAKQIKKSSPLLKMVISQSNIEDVEPFYRLAVSLKFTPEYAFIYRSGNGCAGWEDKKLTAQQKLRVVRLIDRLNKEHKTEALLPFCTNKCPYTKDAEEMSICIKPDGTIQPCQTLYDSHYALGNIFAFSLDALQGKVSEHLKLAQKRTQCEFDCLKCLLNNNCGKGCLATAFNLHKDPLANDENCEYRRLQFLGHDLRNILESV